MNDQDYAAYGLRGGRLLFIADVPRGLACDCVCADCKRALVAKKGTVRRHHFAHYETTDCSGGSETVLHLLAKELLAELTTIAIPPYTFEKQRKTRTGTLVEHRALVAKGGIVDVHRIQVEHMEGSFRPDVVIESGAKRLILEVAVTNKVDRSKLRKIRRRNVPAIQLFLNCEDAFLSRDLLKAKLRDDLSSKSWLFHPAQREVEQAFFTKLREARAYERAERIKIQSASRSKTRPSIQANASKLRSPYWSVYDRTAEEFNRLHNRYPTLDECKRLWPHLWKS